MYILRFELKQHVSALYDHHRVLVRLHNGDDTP